MKILVVDNYDSFVYNLVHYIEQLGNYTVVVKRNDAIALSEVEAYDKILLSPGPGIPSEAGLMPQIIQQYATRKNILGVCLGHQALAEGLGCELENRKEVLHGIASDMFIKKNDPLYINLPKQFKVGRYHSWQVKKENLHPDWEIITEDEAGCILGIKHKKHPLFGVQYHPESILTENGLKIIQNWLELTD